MERRVVITGLGAITPIGKDVNESWNSILNKKCGIDNISLFDNSTFKTKVDAEVKNYESQEYFDLKQSKRLDRSSQFAIIASREAFKDSGITKENSDPRTRIEHETGTSRLRRTCARCTEAYLPRSEYSKSRKMGRFCRRVSLSFLESGRSLICYYPKTVHQGTNPSLRDRSYLWRRPFQ